MDARADIKISVLITTCGLPEYHDFPVDGQGFRLPFQKSMSFYHDVGEILAPPLAISTPFHGSNCACMLATSTHTTLDGTGTAFSIYHSLEYLDLTHLFTCSLMSIITSIISHGQNHTAYSVV